MSPATKAAAKVGKSLAAGGVSMADQRRDAQLERRALREARSADKARERETVAEFEEGRRHERRVQDNRRARRQHPASKAARSGTRRGRRQVARGATAPAAGVALSGAALFGTMLSLVALYLVLTSAETVSEVVRLTRRGLRWLASPSKSIPYGKES